MVQADLSVSQLNLSKCCGPRIAVQTKEGGGAKPATKLCPRKNFLEFPYYCDIAGCLFQEQKKFSMLDFFNN